MYKDWCPLCGMRFEDDTSEGILQKILDHSEEKDGQKSQCSQNFRPFAEVIADDHY